MPTIDPDWTAPRVGQNWRDDELMLAVAWLKSFVPRRDMDRRIDAAKGTLDDLGALFHHFSGSFFFLTI